MLTIGTPRSPVLVVGREYGLGLALSTRARLRARFRAPREATALTEVRFLLLLLLPAVLKRAFPQSETT